GLILAGTTGLRLRLWDGRTGKELHPLPEGFGFTPAVAVSPDGRLLASGEWINRLVSVWDTTSGQLVREVRLPLELRYARNLAFSADARTLTACLAGGTLLSWDVTTGKEVRRVQLRD